MPSHLKERVRARMEKTGEGYQQALRHVRARQERAPSAPRASPLDENTARSRAVADTAFSVAAVRAEEGDLPEGERLFTDPSAAAFAAAGAHATESTQRYLDLPFFREGIRLRTRFVDDCVPVSAGARATRAHERGREDPGAHPIRPLRFRHARTGLRRRRMTPSTGTRSARRSSSARTPSARSSAASRRTRRTAASATRTTRPSRSSRAATAETSGGDERAIPTAAPFPHHDAVGLVRAGGVVFAALAVRRRSAPASARIPTAAGRRRRRRGLPPTRGYAAAARSQRHAVDRLSARLSPTGAERVGRPERRLRRPRRGRPGELPSGLRARGGARFPGHHGHTARAVLVRRAGDGGELVEVRPRGVDRGARRRVARRPVRRRRSRAARARHRALLHAVLRREEHRARQARRAAPAAGHRQHDDEVRGHRLCGLRGEPALRPPHQLDGARALASPRERPQRAALPPPRARGRLPGAARALARHRRDQGLRLPADEGRGPRATGSRPVRSRPSSSGRAGPRRSRRGGTSSRAGPPTGASSSISSLPSTT